MPQLNYTQNAVIGQPGQAFDAEAFSRDVVSRVCSAVIPFGTICAMDANGFAVPVQDATTGGAFQPKLLGIALYDALAVEEAYAAPPVPPTGAGSSSVGYPIGRAVPFMRKGRIWVAGDATGTATRYGAINVNHSSTGAFAQGVFTFSAVSATVGHEIDIAPICVVWNPDLIGGTTGISVTDPFGNIFKIYPVEINL